MKTERITSRQATATDQGEENRNEGEWKRRGKKAARCARVRKRPSATGKRGLGNNGAVEEKNAWRREGRGGRQRNPPKDRAHSERGPTERVVEKEGWKGMKGEKESCQNNMGLGIPRGNARGRKSRHTKEEKKASGQAARIRGTPKTGKKKDPRREAKMGDHQGEGWVKREPGTKNSENNERAAWQKCGQGGGGGQGMSQQPSWQDREVICEDQGKPTQKIKQGRKCQPSAHGGQPEATTGERSDRGRGSTKPRGRKGNHQGRSSQVKRVRVAIKERERGEGRGKVRKQRRKRLPTTKTGQAKEKEPRREATHKGNTRDGGQQRRKREKQLGLQQEGEAPATQMHQHIHQGGKGGGKNHHYCKLA